MSNNQVHPAFRSILNAIAPPDDRIARARELGLPTTVKEATQRPLLADAHTIRAAIFDVIETGNNSYVWQLDVLDEDAANAERGQFADAVEKRIRELQAPPFNLGIKLENYCHKHRGKRLPDSTTAVCADCEAEYRTR